MVLSVVISLWSVKIEVGSIENISGFLIIFWISANVALCKFNFFNTSASSSALYALLNVKWTWSFFSDRSHSMVVSSSALNTIKGNAILVSSSSVDVFSVFSSNLAFALFLSTSLTNAICCTNWSCISCSNWRVFFSKSSFCFSNF